MQVIVLSEVLEYFEDLVNKSTTWYAFFTAYWENGKTIYLVRYVANNHTIAQYL